ncbi:MAG: N-acetylneuraminate synthase family protein [Actinobacteria bacterium]|nr:N-acetylneuraminate synthase family protein [Actinomycetota bacterium]
MDQVLIDGKKIGSGEPVFIVAEAGSNHDGKLEQAKLLTETAAGCGADAIKFQSFKADSFVSREDQEDVPSMHQAVKKVELPCQWHRELADYARDKGLVFLSTPFDEEAVDLLDELGVSAFKVASSDLWHLPLIEYIASKGKPMIVSTGMANFDDIEKALGAVQQGGGPPVCLLHCVADYPAAPKDLNLRAIPAMAAEFSLPVGYSDHSKGIFAPVAAVALGACVIEKHFTLDRNLPGPDHPFAIEPDELGQMVSYIRATEAAMGTGEKQMAESEIKTFKIARRSIFADAYIGKGTTISSEMVKMLRPGTGISPWYLNEVIGSVAAKDIRAGEPISWEQLKKKK